MARAGSKELREIKKKKLDEIRAKEEEARSEYKGKLWGVSREDYEVYFGSWIYQAIEILVSIPKYQQIGSICDYFNLSKKDVLSVLNFLVEKGLIEKKGNRYIRKLEISMLGNLPRIYHSKHKINWRTRSLCSLDQEDEDDFHLTVVTSLAEKDVPRLVDFLHEKAGEFVHSIEDSPREDIRCLCIDFFKVK